MFWGVHINVLQIHVDWDRTMSMRPKVPPHMQVLPEKKGRRQGYAQRKCSVRHLSAHTHPQCNPDARIVRAAESTAAASTARTPVKATS